MNSMKHFIVILLALCFLNCSYSPNAVRVEIDSTFPPDKQILILQALNDWETKTNHSFGVASISYPDGLSQQSAANCIKFINKDLEADHISSSIIEFGLTTTEYSTVSEPEDHVQAVIYIWFGLKDNQFQQTVRHELGHAVLLGHYCTQQQASETYFACQVVSTNPQPSVMYPLTDGQTTTLQPIDILRFCQLWGCPKS
jgi:hypothetical protein